MQGWIRPIGLAIAMLALAACTKTSSTVTPTTAGTTGTASPSGPGAPADFVALSDVDPGIQQDIRYATAHNFVGRPIVGYAEPVCLLTRTAAHALSQVQTAARAHGYGLKVYDCYRPQRAADEFVAWAAHPDDQAMKAEFYPAVAKADLFRDGYLGAPTAHSRGSTMDLTLVPLRSAIPPPFTPGQPLVACTATARQRFPDNSADMGTGFDCFDPRAHSADHRVTPAQADNRRLLEDLMAAQGFTNYADEWWHYSLTDEPYPHTFFDFPVDRASVSRGG